jgi:uncharacterized membrane protein YphA (DoxX/SURF4 family)
VNQPVKHVLLLAAVVATFWAAISWVTGFDTDFKAAAVVAITCLGGVFVIDHRAEERARAAHSRYLWETDIEADFEQLREID